MSKIVVLGGGICGLGTAILLARDGHDVTVLERDDSPIPDSPEQAWSDWDRKGVGQFRQPHNFMPGMRAILEQELPDVQEALRRAGAGRFDLLNPLPDFFTDRSERTIDDRLWTYTARRPVGEWVFARAASAERGLMLRRGVRAVGFLPGPSVRKGIPHVAGVRTSTGDEFRADLVVDAMGRASKSADWLRATGAAPPFETQEDSGFVYNTRFFQGMAEPERRAPVLSHIGTISVLTLPGDNGTWSVTVISSSSDRALRSLSRAETWTAVVTACPLQAHWLRGEPISDIVTMSGIVDRYRRFVVDGTPVATGFAAVADAWACTNPSAGRGMTVGLKHAVRLRDTARGAIGDPWAFARRFDDATERDIAPWYHSQVAADRHRYAEIEALREGREPPPPRDRLSRQIMSLLATMIADPMLFRTALEYIGTLTPVHEIFERPGLGERVAATMEAMHSQPPPTLPGPSREQLLELAH